MMHSAFLLLGTNLGDRKRNLTFARNTIELAIGAIVQASATYETAAWGKVDQGDFLNLAIEIQTQLDPKSLLHEILQIEKNMGRERDVKWGERIIDIDVLLYDTLMLDSPELTIPHPQLGNRRFALVPLAEIAADVVHPQHNITIREMLSRCTDLLPVKLVK
jgi:2-amino-4-hydroxy-6-hydroxymethyldihydropteridine diphosphokinase